MKKKLLVAGLTAGLMFGGAGVALAGHEEINHGKPSSNACKGLTNAQGRSGGHRSENGQAQLDALQAIACDE